MKKNVAYFVSPHGFGHAARACAVMEALTVLDPQVHFEIFTRAPRWFFDDSLQFPFGYHDLITDIGLVQPSPLVEDLSATLNALASFLPIPPEHLENIKTNLQSLKCSLVLCDISPLGIAAAHAAGLPSILIENFTWDWIYQGYLEVEPRFSQVIPVFARLFNSATSHIQTEPICAPSPTAALSTFPVGRKPRKDKANIRRQLQIPAQSKMVLITMGGFELAYTFIDDLFAQANTYFIVPGGSDHFKINQNLRLLPYHSEYYHPDLVHASDAVISKAGYSTIAEAFHAGIPFGYVSRAQFRESPILSQFIQNQMTGLEINGTTFQNGDWIRQVPQLLNLPTIVRKGPNGSDQIAEFILMNFLD